jgi:hypothetical protein
LMNGISDSGSAESRNRFRKNWRMGTPSFLLRNGPIEERVEDADRAMQRNAGLWREVGS